MNQVKNNSHDFMRADAAYALVKFQVKDAVIELLSLLKTTEDSGLRRQIIIKSGDLGIKEFISDLCELMEHDNSAESFEAVISLVKLGKTNIPENIISKMQRGLYSRFIHNDIKEKMRITLKMLGRDEK
jgi:HEAT repeat protein